MNKFSVDYTELQSKLSKKQAYRLVDVKHRIRKVAFDVVRFVDSDKIDDLWQIHRDGDDEYIVAMYDDADNKKESAKTASSTVWNAVQDVAGNYVNVFYHGNPVKKICLAELGISPEDAYLVCQSLKDKLANDKAFLRKFANELDDIEIEELKETVPSK